MPIRVLTYNIWGIFVAPDADGRITAFAKSSLPASYDVICLQELFDDRHFKQLTEAFKLSHPYTNRFVTSKIGNGLAVFSRFPVVDTHFEQFYVQGDPEKVWHGDYYCNKGILLTRIRVPRSALLDSKVSGHIVLNIYNTHTVACYEKYSKVGYEGETNSGARMSQMAQAIRFIELTSSAADHVLFAGDFNVGGPNSPEMKMLKTHFALHQASRLDEPVATTLRSVLSGPIEKQYTYSDENKHNARTGNYFKILDMEEDKPVQLDHMLLSSPELKVLHSEVCMKEECYKWKDGSMVPLSDHFGLMAVLGLEGIDQGEAPPVVDVQDLQFAISFLIRRSKRLQAERRKMYMGIAIFLLFLPVLFSNFLHWTAAVTGLITSGFSAAICLIVGRTQRNNDSVTLCWQAEDLKLVLDRTDSGSPLKSTAPRCFE
jgi:sphingomyelin phosphodiesterase 2